MSPDLMIIHACNRHDELLREAAHERLVQAAHNGRADLNGRSSQDGLIRYLVGVRLEHLACWLQGCIPSCTCAPRAG